MLPGEYVPTFTTTTYVIDHAITLRGEPGQTRPRLTSDTGTFFVPGPLVEVTEPGAVVEGIRLKVSGSRGPALKVAAGASTSIVRDIHIEGVEFNSSGSMVVLEGSSTLERAELIRFDTTPPGLDGIIIQATGNVLVRDSVIRQVGDDVAIRTAGPSTGAKLRNVTVASGGNAIIGTTGPQQLSIRNALIDGANADINVNGAGVEYSIAYSNYNPGQVVAAGGALVAQTPPNQDQAAAGLFPDLLDPLNGNFRQRATSPTRNAGSPDAFTGTLDFEWQPRVMGGAIDIGADEFFETPDDPSDPSDPGDPGGSGNSGDPSDPTVPGGSPAPGGPVASLRFIKLKRNKKRGIAVLVVKLSGPGDISLRGPGIKPIRPRKAAETSRHTLGGRIHCGSCQPRTRRGESCGGLSATRAGRPGGSASDSSRPTARRSLAAVR